MAEAMARSLGGDSVCAFSAGLAPAGFIAEPTIQTLAAMGYPNNGLRSKGFDEIASDSIDLVISLLGDRGLNVIPHEYGARREAWPVPDPFGEDETFYLHVGRQIEARVRKMLADELEEELLIP